MVGWLTGLMAWGGTGLGVATTVDVVKTGGTYTKEAIDMAEKGINYVSDTIDEEIAENPEGVAADITKQAKAVPGRLDTGLDRFTRSYQDGKGLWDSLKAGFTSAADANADELLAKQAAEEAAKPPPAPDADKTQTTFNRNAAETPESETPTSAAPEESEAEEKPWYDISQYFSGLSGGKDGAGFKSLIDDGLAGITSFLIGSWITNSFIGEKDTWMGKAGKAGLTLSIAGTLLAGYKKFLEEPLMGGLNKVFASEANDTSKATPEATNVYLDVNSGELSVDARGTKPVSTPAIEAPAPGM